MWQPRRLFGVPFRQDARDAFTKRYLARYRDDILRKGGYAIPDDDVERSAKLRLQEFVEQALHQYAGRSQTLLTVTALVVAIFSQISEKSPLMRTALILWALISLSLIYNIFIHFFKERNDVSQAEVFNEDDYNDTLSILYNRCIIFNGNVGVTTFFTIICAAIYLYDLFVK